MSALVRTLKQTEATMGTHLLEREDVETGQDIETKRGSEGNSLPGGGRRRD